MSDLTPSPIHYLTALESYMDPNNGTVCYWYAKVCAKLLNISDAFFADYGCMEGRRVDVGEFNVWAVDLLCIELD